MGALPAGFADAKTCVLAQLNAGLVGLKLAELRARRPDLAEEERRSIVRRWWLTAAD